MRHLIVAGSRVTHGKYLHTLRPQEQEIFLRRCKMCNLQHDVGLMDLPREPTFCIPVDEPWVFGDTW